jgi:hypothetical protein
MYLQDGTVARSSYARSLRKTVRLRPETVSLRYFAEAAAVRCLASSASKDARASFA